MRIVVCEASAHSYEAIGISVEFVLKTVQLRSTHIEIDGIHEILDGKKDVTQQ